jgi:hypothetical protein
MTLTKQHAVVHALYITTLYKLHTKGSYMKYVNPLTAHVRYETHALFPSLMDSTNIANTKAINVPFPCVSNGNYPY